MMATAVLILTVVLAVAGAVFAGLLWADAREDVRAMQGVGNGRLTMAYARSRQAGFGFGYTLLVAFNAAVLAWLMIPIVDDRAGRMRWEVYAVLGGMFLTAALVSLDGWLARRETRLVEAKIREAMGDNGHDL